MAGYSTIIEAYTIEKGYAQKVYALYELWKRVFYVFYDERRGGREGWKLLGAIIDSYVEAQVSLGKY